MTIYRDSFYNPESIGNLTTAGWWLQLLSACYVESAEEITEARSALGIAGCTP